MLMFHQFKKRTTENRDCERSLEKHPTIVLISRVPLHVLFKFLFQNFVNNLNGGNFFHEVTTH
jgi:hypothetical protein